MELICDCPQPTPMILTLHIHTTRVSDIIVPYHLITKPSIPITAYRDYVLSLHEYSGALLYRLFE